MQVEAGKGEGEMAAFCRLRDAAEYVASPWDLSREAAPRAYFVAFFRAQYRRTLQLAVAQAVLEGRDDASAQRSADECLREFFAYLDRLEQRPEAMGRTTILTIDGVRDGWLRAAGFQDPYLHQKQAQNAVALAMLPGLLGELDELSPRPCLEAAVRGALVGNIFDMGVTATAQRMLNCELEFVRTRDTLPPRPWLVDGLDALVARAAGSAYRRAVVFVDNAGSDFVLGMIPLCYSLARQGTQVVIAANELPTLNDMTAADVRALWPALEEAAPELRQCAIETVSTGTAEPLIDLSRVSRGLNEAATDADLVILEGMGRALESNYDARFDCDVLKIAMIKDEFVARWLGGSVYDVVCRFEAADCGGRRGRCSEREDRRRRRGLSPAAG
jgi:type II pantothenate kinase